MKNFKFSDIKKTSVYITPNLPATRTKRYKVSLKRIILISTIYTIFIAVLATVLLAVTPAKKYVFFLENAKLEVQEERLSDLHSKLLYLANEMKEISSAEKRLEIETALAGRDTTDPEARKYIDSLKEKIEAPPPIEGNILGGLVNVANRIYNLFADTGDVKKTVYFLKPADGYIVKKFDESTGHYGIDIASKKNTPVYGVRGGLVLFAGYKVDDGYTLMIQHDDGFISIYKHCSSLLKKEREYIVQGETIALSGNSGENTTGPHLHFEIWQNGKPVDPEDFLINMSGAPNGEK